MCTSNYIPTYEWIADHKEANFNDLLRLLTGKTCRIQGTVTSCAAQCLIEPNSPRAGAWYDSLKQDLIVPGLLRWLRSPLPDRKANLENMQAQPDEQPHGIAKC